MADVAGIFLSPLLQVFFERVASREFVNFFRGQKLDQALLNELKIALLSVNAVFEDAEEKQMANPNVKEWLDELKVAIYDAEDILDEIDTEATRCKLDAEFHTTASKVRKAISTSFKPFVKEIEPKIKQLLERLESLVRRKDIIGLKDGIQGKSSQRLPTTSLVEESGICGREDDKEKIINSMFSEDVSGNKSFVIAIVGMGGVGKTTLAQLIYNDKRVKEYFDLKAWACVSENFDIFTVTKAILERVCSSDKGDGETLDWLQSTLKESLKGQKFLFVLDDVWNYDFINWEVLSNPFRVGAQGSRVLVTTREEGAASIMRPILTYNLKPLPEKECWSLFVSHAFHGSIFDMHPELEAIGRQIVEKCKGLPLAAKTIGALLSSKVGVDDWNRILKSELWDMPTEIIPALRLSYKYLPSYLKRCFAYCSIFPKGHFFLKDELVSLWMAEGFLKNSEGKIMEQVGDDYISDLVSRSLLQQSSVNNYRFGMHDLVNDLARFVSRQFILRLEGSNSLQVTNKTRHLSIVTKSFENMPKTLEALYEAKGLRTFLPIDVWNGILLTKFPHDLLPKLRFLRVLSFKNDINLTELPDSIGNIRHLRYLDLSDTPIRKLPDSICQLCNLQILRLMWCSDLTVLPKDMHKLVSLRHLVLYRTAITEMPLHLGRLKCLQTLGEFVVSKKNSGSSIGELGKLEDIGGELSIRKLQNVKSPMDALDASLKDKKRLKGLELLWDDTTSSISESQLIVLENLQPHTNLNNLFIYNYGGKSFPDWIAHHSFSKMKYLFLYNCKYCHILPAFGQLHSLQWLYITGFHGIARVGKEFYGSGSSMFKPFEALKFLRFKDMPDWENWFCFDECEAFPRLEELEIVKCPKLTGGLPIHLPSLAKLAIAECSQLKSSLPRSPTLRELKLTNFNEVLLNEFPSGLQIVVLEGCAAIRSLPEGMMDFSSPLQRLEIDGCPSLKFLSDDDLPSTLETLKISNCKKLEFAAHFNYSSLKELYLENSCDSLRCFPVNLIAEIDFLTIKGCGNLECLTDSEQHESDLAAWIIRIENCPNFVLFPNPGLRAQKLKRFEIHDCGSLRSLPDKMHLLLPSLESLSICKCPMLQSFGEGGLPTNIKSIFIEDCDILVARRTTWGLQKLPSLRKLSISGKCEDVESFPQPSLLPMTMTSLTISGFSNMKSLDKKGLQQLTFLEKLYILNLPSLKFTPEERTFDSISTLIHLSISGIPTMTSLDYLGLQRLTSLKHMEIYDCPNLKVVPKNGFPASISTLKIHKCPLLEKQLQNKKGKEWHKVAHIPHIEINDQLI
ncbi:hypothetical protein I3760_14G109300 [Carya illinoinensis]|nr:hypothetical protein I3760_14G109300 [Carya illinoinensis]KAG2670930.1 hypothetical protein I3760_14G109300 [Carya illinoinensis]